MNTSRREFMLKGVFAVGREIVESLKDSSANSAEIISAKNYRYLTLDNSRCLAQRGGCFACMDHCPQAAVSIDLGIGIAIENELCDGCGECAAVCPISPKVITMKPLEAD